MILYNIMITKTLRQKQETPFLAYNIFPIKSTLNLENIFISYKSFEEKIAGFKALDLFQVFFIFNSIL